jgi:hypothetical protein
VNTLSAVEITEHDRVAAMHRLDEAIREIGPWPVAPYTSFEGAFRALNDLGYDVTITLTDAGNRPGRMTVTTGE